MMYLLHKNEYRIFKLLKSSQDRTKAERRKIEGINQSDYHTYMHGNVTVKYPV
jgi:hypothetical protein